MICKGDTTAMYKYDFDEYKLLGEPEKAEKSEIWQIHAFGEGNTRTTAVFTIKYLRTFGFTVTNNMFTNHSWYFRNALVRANFNDYKNNIYGTLEYLNQFFRNLLLGENTPLKNRDLHIKALSTDANVPVNVPVKRKDEILKHLLNYPKLTAEELAAIFSVTARTIKRDFTSLKNEGKIKRIGSDKTGYWKIIQ